MAQKRPRADSNNSNGSEPFGFQFSVFSFQFSVVGVSWLPAVGLRKHNKRWHRCGMMDRKYRKYRKDGDRQNRMDPLIPLINPIQPILDPSDTSDTSDPKPKENPSDTSDPKPKENPSHQLKRAYDLGGRGRTLKTEN